MAKAAKKAKRKKYAGTSWGVVATVKGEDEFTSYPTRERARLMARIWVKQAHPRIVRVRITEL